MFARSAYASMVSPPRLLRSRPSQREGGFLSMAPLRMAPIRVAMLAACLGLLSGCQSMDRIGKLPLPWSSGDEFIASDYQSPERMAVIWTDATYNSAGRRSVRGFGGRIYFYNQQGTAVPVEGQLVVYAFDDTDQQGPSRRPNRKFVFTPEQFTERFSESELGASYSVWLPWDEIGGEPKSISLLPIFTASSGQVITGAQSINLLPGVKKQPERAFTRTEPEPAPVRRPISKVQPAAYERAAELRQLPAVAAYQETVGGEEPAGGTLSQMETTTIRTRGTLAERILNQPRQISSLEGNRSIQPRPANKSSNAPVSNFSIRPGDNYRGSVHELRRADLRVLEDQSPSKSKEPNQE